MPSLPTEPSASSSIPRIAFLGWCDRFAENKAGQPILWHMNLLGVSQHRASAFYPLPLQGQYLLIGLFEPHGGETFCLDFREANLGRSVDLTIKIEELQLIDPITGEVLVSPAGSHVPGWTLRIIPLNQDFVVMEPGRYDVYLRADGGDQFLGTTQFVFATSQVQDPGQIEALKSDPLTGKLVRMSMNCKLCPSIFRVYAALERNPKLEEEGYLWYRSLGSRFVCECGKTQFPLDYLREGLGGALVHNLQPASSQNVGLVKLYEISALEETCREFLKLIETATSEEPVQQFLESHQVFWHSFAPTRLMSKRPILTKYTTDFVILNERKELLLVEIEKPSTPLVKDDGAMRYELQHAVAQVNNWLQEVSERREAALHCIGLRMEDVVRIGGMVVAGRTPKDPGLNRALRSWNPGEIEILTFDDLLHRTREVIRHVANV